MAHRCRHRRKCKDCEIRELDKSDESTSRSVFPRPNGGSILLAWVEKNCKFAQAKQMTVRASMLYGWRPKVEETVIDLREGRTSRSAGPVEVSKLDSIRGGWFVIDGHHRAMEMMARGETSIPCAVNPHVPFFERPVSAHQNMTADMVRLLDSTQEAV